MSPSETTAPPGPSPAFGPLGALALVSFALLAWRFDFLTDDAYISFRYARNLAEGHGLVWNAGQPPVEGYSNLLWVLVLSAGEVVGLAPALLARGLSVLAALALLWAVRRELSARGAEPGPGTLLLASLPPFALWSTGGLETMAFAWALFGCFSAQGRRAGPAAALLGALATGLRADGLAWVLLVSVAGWLSAKRPGRATLWALGGAGLFAAAQIAFRLDYYGDWLPNTARAKVSWSQLDPELRSAFLKRGAFYVLSNLLAVPSLLLAFGFALRGGLTALPFLAVALGGVGYSVLVGGDFMTMGRFLVPTLPFLALAFGLGLARLSSKSAAAWGLAALALSGAAAFDLSPFPRSLRDRLHFRWNAPEAVSEVEMWRNMSRRTGELVQLGRALAVATGEDEVATYGPVGAVGYHSRHVIHDTYGLTSRDLLEHSTLGDTLRSPGHDRRVDPARIRELPLTYLDAAVVPTGTPLAPLPPGAPWRWEQHPLPEDEGFEPGLVLRLLRP